MARIRIRPARQYQKPNDPVLRISRRAQPHVSLALRKAFGSLKEMVPVDKVAEAIKAGRDPRPLINWHHYREVLKGTFGLLAELHREGARIGEDKINAAFQRAGRRMRYRKPGLRKAVGDRFEFDTLSQDTQNRVREAQDELIQQLESDARDTIETTITYGLNNGLTVDDMAVDIRDVIGLTERQAQAVLNYQSMLYDLDPAALTRQLRNTATDDALQEAIDSGTELSDDAIEQMTQDYIDNYLDYRADTIARTESSRAANEGLHEAYSQAIDRGALTDDAVKREWQLGDEPCPICESILDNNPDGVGVDEDFDSDDGPVSDPPVHPNCECSVDYVTDLTQLPDDEEDDTENDEEAT